jgi:DNA-binding transcriptional LysR family regulator
LAATLDIALLRTFVAVADARSLSRAAPRVGRTQAAVSMQIKKLEDIIGQPLLNRGGRGVGLTGEGGRLLARAQEILSRHDETLAELTGKGLSGVLRLGCPDDYAASFLPALIRDFVGRHPNVLIEVVCASTPRLHERLKEHAIDVALASVLADGSAETIIRREALAWIAKSPAALAIDPLPLALSDPDGVDHIAARRGLEAQGRRYRLAYASGSLTGLLAFVRSGQALAVIARSAIPPDLQILGPESGLPNLPALGIIIAFDRPRPSALATAFAEHARAVLPGI